MEADIDAGLQKNSGGPEQSRLRMLGAHGTCASMGAIQPSRARKRSTNVSLDQALVDEAKQLGISISSACEQGLAAQVKAERQRRWIEENAEEFRSYNEWIRENGLPLARYRSF